jgi:hypothetical protein
MRSAICDVCISFVKNCIGDIAGKWCQFGHYMTWCPGISIEYTIRNSVCTGFVIGGSLQTYNVCDTFWEGRNIHVYCTAQTIHDVPFIFAISHIDFKRVKLNCPEIQT